MTDTATPEAETVEQPAQPVQLSTEVAAYKVLFEAARKSHGTADEHALIAQAGMIVANVIDHSAAQIAVLQARVAELEGRPSRPVRRAAAKAAKRAPVKRALAKRAPAKKKAGK